MAVWKASCLVEQILASVVESVAPIGLLHAATSVPNHMASELQDLRPPLGVSVDLCLERPLDGLGGQRY
ncbi:hypothetical protein [Nonomuraea dietziae]|uniref:hypothetical protein n=1 Tax=Nonomuraea dietziae TaxID=65515 RepID=UPI0033E2F7DB